MTISELGYELYKIDWERRISAERKQDVWKNYYQDANIKDYPFLKYFEDVGYDGELYVWYDEFLNAEYLNELYMKELFDNDELFAEYQKDLKDNFYVD